ncbi:hypothetical protein [Kitasatospora sp. NPDC056800]|uniref:hypothetical protein n=1 Tax=Kitasatospora sp. NPDC056800 TaxID=3345948 RepID=UPI0036BFD870
MPPKSKVTFEQVWGAVYEKDGRQKRSYQEAADFLGVHKQTVASALRKNSATVNADVNMTGFLPENFKSEHGGEKEATALRALAEQEAGKEISNARAEAAERFREKSGSYICAYDPEYGFYWLRRDAGDNRWLFE